MQADESHPSLFPGMCCKTQSRNLMLLLPLDLREVNLTTKVFVHILMNIRQI